MTNRFTGYDVRNKVVTLLQDVSAGFNSIIGTINTERTHTAPTANVITHKWGQNQFPFVFVDLNGSEIDYNGATLNLDYTNLPETYTINVVGFMKAGDDRLTDWVEDWLEGFIRVLHNYHDSDISWIALTRTDRTDLYKNQNETYKMFAAEFEVRVN